MTWNDAKRIIGIISIGVFVLRWLSHLLIFWPLLQDDEFEQALDWAQGVWIDAEQIRDAPFRFVTRAQAAYRYVAFAQSSDMVLYSDDICQFNDIRWYTWTDLDMIQLACGYRFFRWSQWSYAPDSYLTKAGSLVALMKWFYPTRDFEIIEPYREPFVKQAKNLGITKRDSNPYMMYLVPKYELILQLYRAYQSRKNG